jgi:hypothetical protein
MNQAQLNVMLTIVHSPSVGYLAFSRHDEQAIYGMDEA